MTEPSKIIVTEYDWKKIWERYRDLIIKEFACGVCWPADLRQRG